MVFTALCVAIGILLPMVFHMVPVANTGAVFIPMHIPVLICGFLCGWPYGALCGITVPLLSSALTGMPPLFPVAVSMVFELCAYGALAGLLYKLTKGKIYLTLIGAMIGGRIVMGIANAVIFGVIGKAYGIQAFTATALITALPGITIQLALVPSIIYALKKSKITA